MYAATWTSSRGKLFSKSFVWQQLKKKITIVCFISSTNNGKQWAVIHRAALLADRKKDTFFTEMLPTGHYVTRSRGQFNLSKSNPFLTKTYSCLSMRIGSLLLQMLPLDQEVRVSSQWALDVRFVMSVLLQLNVSTYVSVNGVDILSMWKLLPPWATGAQRLIDLFFFGKFVSEFGLDVWLAEAPTPVSISWLHIS